MPDLGQRIYEMFHPHAAARAARVDRFAYYTRAETALSVIQNETIWMRKTTCMNDYRELTFGRGLLNDQLAFRREPLERALDAAFPGLATNVIKEFQDNSSAMMDDTYIACVSEHGRREDKLGRLSMWRAYGGTTGVAIIFKKEAANLQGLAYYASPVLYTDEASFGHHFDEVVHALAARPTLIRSIGRDFARRALAFALQSALASIKHRGFEEELEWRIIYNPQVQSQEGMSPVIRVVNGVPQLVYEIALKEGLSKYSLLNLIDQLIIGPTQYPNEIAEALRTALAAKGAGHIPIVLSDIPLRHNA